VQELKQAQPKACDACGACNTGDRIQPLRRINEANFTIALAGNPNTGKSTVFNALTGMRQHVGNWPGKTVVREEGAFKFRDKTYKVVDLPGTYSLLSNSLDEEIARDFVLFGRPDCVVVVVDATALERNLALVLQLLEITDRVVVALNLMDEAERRGLKIDDRALARDLGVPVVPMAARNRKGLLELAATVSDVVHGEVALHPHRIESLEPGVDKAVKTLVNVLEKQYPGIDNARWVALRLLEGDPGIEDEVRRGTLGHAVHGEPSLVGGA
jgi:ferrous iron transport protein B